MRSQLEYASTVWLPWQNVLINSIEKIQCHAARYVDNDYNPYSSVTNHLIDLNWEPLEAHRIKSRLCMFYKITHNYITILLIQLSFSKNTTRQSNNYKFLQIPRRKNSYKQSFSPKTIPYWNNLPLSIVDAYPLDQF